MADSVTLQKISANRNSGGSVLLSDVMLCAVEAPAKMKQTQTISTVNNIINLSGSVPQKQGGRYGLHI